jgi:hypothetical protein
VPGLRARRGPGASSNDADAARRLSTRFYQLLRKGTGEGFNSGRAAWLEVEWWRVHREAQHAEGSGPSEELTVTLRDLYAYTYSADPADVRANLLAAVHR